MNGFHLPEDGYYLWKVLMISSVQMSSSYLSHLERYLCWLLFARCSLAKLVDENITVNTSVNMVSRVFILECHQSSKM